MIDHTRFLARSSDRDLWLAARRDGVTATEVANAATPAGFKTALERRSGPQDDIEVNEYMKFGLDNEGWIALWLKDREGIMPNDWLIAADPIHQFRATPDGISLDHTRIAEIKTTGKDWGEWKSVPIQYRRQVAWQLFVTGATECVFAWLLRAETQGRMIPAWMEPKFVTVERDEKMITELVDVADRLLMAEVYRSQEG